MARNKDCLLWMTIKRKLLRTTRPTSRNNQDITTVFHIVHTNNESFGYEDYNISSNCTTAQDEAHDNACSYFAYREDHAAIAIQTWHAIVDLRFIACFCHLYLTLFVCDSLLPISLIDNMHRPTDAVSSSYYHQYYDQRPAADLPQLHNPSVPAPSPYSPHASAPPFTASPSDYSNYPSLPTDPDHAPNLGQYPPPQLHEPPHNHRHPYLQTQAPANYDYTFPTDPTPNPGRNSEPGFDPPYSLNSYLYGSSYPPYSANSCESNLNHGGGDRGVFDAGVFKYNGGQPQSAYGEKDGRSSGSGSGGEVMFDDYGRPINVPGGKDQGGSGSSLHNIVKAVPKAEDVEDVRSGIQKFRVKLLSEGFDQNDMDVLCQHNRGGSNFRTSDAIAVVVTIGLDGICVLDPATSRTLKIYPLESVTRWEVLDSYIFAFWAKTSVDLEPRRIRLKSNSYTTNNILDLVTAASIQSKEIGSSHNSPDLVKGTEQSAEKKKGFIDWKNIIKPANEEKDHWVPDEAVTKCTTCRADFSAFNRRHHCRNCGDIFCDKCTQGRIALTEEEHAQPVRVCDQCMAEVTQRLSNKVPPGRPAGLQSHEDLARKLQHILSHIVDLHEVIEEMNKNRKTVVANFYAYLVGAKSEASGMRMREVACPTCTVHLQVQVPASGSETIECSVCQHPFLDPPSHPRKRSSPHPTSLRKLAAQLDECRRHGGPKALRNQ
ncbi:lateral signaling target protein-like protein [Striga asiatica]|uniref:Lateral signaling target protein-like protein n=1 Tax=Striga asiatica TaxID=4170 RepID=A0A5A7P127_STRAF|nr:lateral signaling target protein-like protein [Striga asiatica]